VSVRCRDGCIRNPRFIHATALRARTARPRTAATGL
jgi:hypothetical protein